MLPPHLSNLAMSLDWRKGPTRLPSALELGSTLASAVARAHYVLHQEKYREKENCGPHPQHGRAFTSASRSSMEALYDPFRFVSNATDTLWDLPLHSRHHNFRLHKLLEPHVHIHIPLVLPSLTGSNVARPSGISISKRLVLFVRTGTNTSYTSPISSSSDEIKSIDDTAATVPRNPLQSRSALHESSCFTAFGQHIHPVAVDSTGS